MVNNRHREKFDAPNGFSVAATLENCWKSVSFVLHSRLFLSLVAFVFLIDGVLIGLGISSIYDHIEGIPSPTWFDLTLEFSLGEMWEYILTTIASVSLLWKFWKYREPILACLGGVFALLTLDNMAALHEKSGELLAPLLTFAAGTGAYPHDYGELATFLIVGAAILIAVVWTVPRSSVHANSQSLAIVSCLAIGAAFGVGVDFLDRLFHDVPPIALGAMILMEDGSELVLLSIAAALAVSLDMRASRK